MPVTKYVGRVTDFSGKKLFDILCRLKYFGVGRMVYRNTFSERYAEPSYYVITRVDPNMEDPPGLIDDPKKYSSSKAWGKKVFRGEAFGDCCINTCYKADWRLVPRSEEPKWLDYELKERDRSVVPDTVALPPLYVLLWKQQREMEGKSTDLPVLKATIAKSKFNRAVLESEAKVLQGDEL